MENNVQEIKRIYHGSDHVIERPQYKLGKPYNDYGFGFYCTETLDMAKEWGASIQKDGFANIYEIDCNGLSILNLNKEPYGLLHWLYVLLNNRTFQITSPLAIEAMEYLNQTFAIDYENPDVIVGYRADDSYFSFASDFINGAISYRQLSRAMYLGKLGEQFVLKSEKAFGAIRFIDCEIAPHEEWFAKRKQRDEEARKQYFNVERNRRQPGDIYITHIIDEAIQPDDARLRLQIAEMISGVE